MEHRYHSRVLLDELCWTDLQKTEHPDKHSITYWLEEMVFLAFYKDTSFNKMFQICI